MSDQNICAIPCPCLPETDKICCVPGPMGPPGPPGPAAPNYDLPLVQRIVFQGTYNGELRPLILELDRPAPQNCYLQFYRYSKKKRHRGTDRDRSFPSKNAFRGVFVDGNSNPFPVIPIPPGQTSVALTDTQWEDIYRPVIIRGWSREWNQAPPGRPWWNPINGIRDSKVIYKFGTCQYVRGETFRASLMSADTLTIKRYYATDHGLRQAESRVYIR